MTKTNWVLAGLAGLVVIWLLLLFFEWEGIEQDVARNVSASLHAAGLDWVSIDTDNRGRDPKLTGVSRIAADIERVEAVAMGARGVRKVVIDEIELRPLLPSWFEVIRSGSTLSLGGRLGDLRGADRLRELIGGVVGAVDEDTLEVSDEVSLANWVGDLEVLAPELGVLENPALGYRDGTLFISGVVRSRNHYDQIAALAPQLDASNTLSLQGVELKPYVSPTLEVTIDGDTASITGNLDTTFRTERLDEALTASVGNTLVVTNQVVVDEDVAVAPWGESAAALLQAFGQVENGSLLIADRTVSVSGVLRSEQAYSALREQLQAMQRVGVNRLDTGNLTLRLYESPRFAVTSSGNTILGSGLVVSTADADKLVAAMELVFGAGDNTQIVVDPDVLEAEWMDHVVRLLPSMTGLEKVSLGAKDSLVRLTGIARTREAFALVAAALERMPEGTYTSEVALRPWKQPSLDISTNGERVETIGMMPDRPTMEKMDQALTALGNRLGLPRNTALVVGDDIQQTGWLNRLMEVLPDLAALSEPGLRVVDGTVTVRGIASGQGEADRIVSLVLQATAGLNMINRVKSGSAANARPVSQATESHAPSVAGMENPGVTDSDVQRCETSLDSQMGANTIEFESESAALVPGSSTVLDHLANAIDRCPDVIIEVGGHTDNTGSEGANLDLSGERALTVVEYLSRAGIPAAKVRAHALAAHSQSGIMKLNRGGP